MTMSARRWTAGAFGIAVMMLGAAIVSAQRPQRDPVMRIWTGVYSSAQAERGQPAFVTTCGTCHNGNLSGGSGPALAGPKFMTKWELEPLTKLFRQIKDNMPRNSPGSLSDAAVVDLMAFILKTNGFPPAMGAASLPTDPEALDAIYIVPQEGPSKIPNFALVQVGGCLTARGDRTWAIQQASEPVTTKDVPATDADLQATSTRLPGDGTFRLVSAAPFAPDAHVGERVLVKGIINRNPAEALLNVTALQTLGQRCTN